MSRFALVVIAFALMVPCAHAGGPSELPASISKASLPELYMLGIANPFPTLYVMNAEGRLILQGKGKDASAFQFDFKMLEDRPLPQTDSVKKVQQYFESYHHRAKAQVPDAAYYAYFFTLDPASFGGQECEPCVEVEGPLIRNIRDSGQAVYLEVVLVAKP